MAIIEDSFADTKPSKPGSLRNSAMPTPVASARATPNVSGDEREKGGGSGLVSGTASPKSKGKKKMTRNQIKAREERRKARKLHWLTFGGKFELNISSLSPSLLWDCPIQARCVETQAETSLFSRVSPLPLALSVDGDLSMCSVSSILLLVNATFVT